MVNGKRCSIKNDRIALAAFDVDGTLINEQKEISQSTVLALKQLKEQGVITIVSSGRPYYALDDKLKQSFSFEYFVCGNGALVMSKEGTFIYQN